MFYVFVIKVNVRQHSVGSVSKLFVKAVSTTVSIIVFRTKTPKTSTLWLCCISFYLKRARFCYKESSTNILICYSQLVSISKLTLTTRNQMQLAFALCALNCVLYTKHITSQENQLFFLRLKLCFILVILQALVYFTQ